MTESSSLIPANYVPLNILLVDDNDADAKIAIRAFNHAKLKNNIYVVNDGSQCFDYLRRTGGFEDVKEYPWPDLIILDISMPKIDGLEVLAEIKKDEALRSTPVIILSGSKNAEDVRKSYSLGANSFIQKPVSYEDFVEVVDGLNFYWLVLNKLPYRI